MDRPTVQELEEEQRQARARAGTAGRLTGADRDRESSPAADERERGVPPSNRDVLCASAHAHLLQAAWYAEDGLPSEAVAEAVHGLAELLHIGAPR
jgi:hypothetical protein